DRLHAKPTPVRSLLALLYSKNGRNLQRLRRARETVSVGKLSGAVGPFAPPDPEVEERVCEKLGLKPAPISTQIIQRDRYAEMLSTLAIIASSMEKIALEVRHLQRTEVREAKSRSPPDRKAPPQSLTNSNPLPPN